MNRRTFLTWVGVGSLASFFPMALALCSNPKDAANPSTRPDGFIPVGTIQELDQNGSIFNSKLPACPHAGCVVKWKADKQEFICPCHGAEFRADGQLMKGPAHKGLKPYIAKVEGNIILIKTS